MLTYSNLICFFFGNFEFQKRHLIERKWAKNPKISLTTFSLCKKNIVCKKSNAVSIYIFVFGR